MSDSYIPDNEPRYILSSLEELAAKKLPHAPTFRKAADEITRLRADLAAVTAERDYVMAEGLFSADQIRILKTDLAAVKEERDRMRTRLDKAHGFISRADWAQFFEEEHVDARAAIEGVTEPSK